MWINCYLLFFPVISIRYICALSYFIPLPNPSLNTLTTVKKKTQLLWCPTDTHHEIRRCFPSPIFVKTTFEKEVCLNTCSQKREIQRSCLCYWKPPARKGFLPLKILQKGRPHYFSNETLGIDGNQKYIMVKLMYQRGFVFTKSRYNNRNEQRFY